MRKHLTVHNSPPRMEAELPVGSCYVSVGGYGVVEIIVRYDRETTGPSVALALPYHSGATPADCLVRPQDTLLIGNAHGPIAEIPVQTVLDRPGFAGFRDLGAKQPPAASGAGMPAFEQFLAGVSARTLNEAERRARDVSDHS